MGRWEPDARGRLERAALELYAERGFDSTTVAEIAARAGLTERTFFRHFADKREVLFGGSSALQDVFTSTVTAAPPTVGPLDAVGLALEAAGAFFDERRPFVVQRQAVIAGHPELRERELIKLATLSGALAEGLRERGVSEPSATLTAEAGIAVFRVAFERWLLDPKSRKFATHVRESLRTLRAVAAPD